MRSGENTKESRGGLFIVVGETNRLFVRMKVNGFGFLPRTREKMADINF
jgi:hypothetical protein